MNDTAQRTQLNILIVEDSKTQAEKLRYILEKRNFRVSTAANGREAMFSMRRQLPDIVVTDIVMPEMDGYELCKHIRADDKLRKVPVILITSLAEPTDVIKGLAAGASNFITKPFDETYIVSRIEHLIANAGLRNKPETVMNIKVSFSGKDYLINAQPLQILDLLLSTYENAYRQNRELLITQKKLTEANARLEEALASVKTLSGLIPICANCKKIRQDSGFWQQIEAYIGDHSNARFSHGICPDCAKTLYPDLFGKPETK
ncbi:MAG: response regulator [Desulforhopalus sp.]|nr:response regulator [Desulforhopalus sp.]